MSAAQQNQMDLRLRGFGWTCHFGKPLGNVSKSAATQCGGVMIAAKNPYVPVATWQDEDYVTLADTGRWTEACIQVGAKGQCIYVASVYGYSGASGGGVIERQNEFLLNLTLKRASGFGFVPIISAGFQSGIFPKYVVSPINPWCFNFNLFIFFSRLGKIL